MKISFVFLVQRVAISAQALMVLGRLTLKRHAALSWKVPECFRTNVRSSSFKDLKFCLGPRTSIWRYGGQSSPLRALNTVLCKLNSMLEIMGSLPGGYKEYHYLLDLLFSQLNLTQNSFLGGCSV